MAVAQIIFKGLPTCKKHSVMAYKAWRGDNFGVADTSGMGFSGPLYFCYQIYRILGGTYNIDKLYNLFKHKEQDAVTYLDPTYIQRINDHLPDSNKVVRSKYNLEPTKKKKVSK